MFDRSLALFITGLDVPVPEHGELLSMTFLENGTKRSVVERDTDLLKAAEKVKYKKEPDSARLEELKRWCEHKAFHRRPRLGSHNRID